VTSPLVRLWRDRTARCGRALLRALLALAVGVAVVAATILLFATLYVAVAGRIGD
jgi:hypothetical protein